MSTKAGARVEGRGSREEKGTGRRSRKSEIRNPKSETNPNKWKSQKQENEGGEISSQLAGNLDFGSVAPSSLAPRPLPLAAPPPPGRARYIMIGGFLGAGKTT